MSRQQISDSQRRWLAGQLADWQADGILSAEQAGRILERYESAEDAGRRKQSLAVFVLLGMAALLLGLAVLLVIGYNWQAIPRPAKLGIILAVLGGVQAGGLWLRFRRQARLASEVVLSLGCLLYGGGIWLVAQVFHLDAHYPDGVWWWALGVLPFALCLDTLLLHALLAALLAVWAGMEVFGYAHLGPWGTAWPGLPNGAYAVVPLALPGLVWAYRKGSPATVGLYVALLAWWAVLQPFAWDMGLYSVFWIGAVGALLLILAEAHQGGALGVPYRLWGVLLVAGLLLVLGYSGTWMELVGWRDSPVVVQSPLHVGRVLLFQALALGGVVAGAVAVVVVLARRAEASERGRAVDLLRRQWFPIALAVFLAGTACWVLAEHANGYLAWLVPTVLSNVILLALTVWLIGTGIREERARPFTAGVLYFLLWAVVRYVDLVGGAGGMLGAALLFFLCAAGLAALAVFWGRLRAAHPRPAEAQAAAAPAWAGPPWLDQAARLIQERQRAVLGVTAACQVGLLAAMIAVNALPLLVGRTVVLKVAPVDPRDLFRGDYVVLSYDLNRIPPQDVEGVPDDEARGGRDVAAWLEDRPVYVTVEPDADGRHWHAVRAGVRPPDAGTYLRGRYAGGSLRLGIEAYYVQEGAGRELEQARNARQLAAEVAVAPWGQAALRRLVPE